MRKGTSKGKLWLLNVQRNHHPTECSEYPYAKDTSGYGLVGGFGSGKSRRAHRVMFELCHGYLPEVVMHACDNPKCCNPNHLRPGTKAENNADRKAKARSAKQVPSRQRLNAEQCAAIIQAKAKGFTYKVLSETYGVDSKIIYNVLRGTYLNGSLL